MLRNPIYKFLSVSYIATAISPLRPSIISTFNYCFICFCGNQNQAKKECAHVNNSLCKTNKLNEIEMSSQFPRKWQPKN